MEDAAKCRVHCIIMFRRGHSYVTHLWANYVGAHNVVNEYLASLQTITQPLGGSLRL